VVWLDRQNRTGTKVQVGQRVEGINILTRVEITVRVVEEGGPIDCGIKGR